MAKNCQGYLKGAQYSGQAYTAPPISGIAITVPPLYQGCGGRVALDKTWFTEVHGKDGSAFSLQFSEHLLSEQTPFQKLDIYQTETFGKLMVLDGCVMLTSRDNFFYHEMLVHPALCAHEKPENVVIIGGGDCGTLQAVLKHDCVKSAHQIEIDEAVTRASEQYFPELCSDNNDPRARLDFIDGVEWMTQQPDASIDVILIDSTDPVGPAEALFGQAFLDQVFRVLKPGGIVAQQSESPLYHLELIADLQQSLFNAGFQAVQTFPFPQPVYPSGWWSATLARKSADLDKVRDFSGKTRYYNRAIHEAAKAMPEFVQERLAKVRAAS